MFIPPIGWSRRLGACNRTSCSNFWQRSPRKVGRPLPDRRSSPVAPFLQADCFRFGDGADLFDLLSGVLFAIGRQIRARDSPHASESVFGFWCCPAQPEGRGQANQAELAISTSSSRRATIHGTPSPESSGAGQSQSPGYISALGLKEQSAFLRARIEKLQGLDNRGELISPGAGSRLVHSSFRTTASRIFFSRHCRRLPSQVSAK